LSAAIQVDVLGDARMVVQHHGAVFGTVGGSRLEYETLAIAVATLSAETPEVAVHVWPLGRNPWSILWRVGADPAAGVVAQFLSKEIAPPP
jgi:xanthine/CO dehydrogenase XdhC/CoxF family maturation factor